MKRTQPSIAKNRQRGFSLIELVAAFMVFAIGAGALMQMLASSMRNVQHSGAYTMAALWAESKLDVVGVGEPIEPGTTNGRFDDVYSWQLDIQLVDPTGIEPPPQQPVMGAGQLGMQMPEGMQQRMTTNAGNPGALQVSPFDIYQVDLTVTWGPRGGTQRSARFSTLRAMNPDPTTQQGADPNMPPGTGRPNGAGAQNGGAVRR